MLNSLGSLLGGSLSRRGIAAGVQRAQRIAAAQQALETLFAGSGLGVPTAAALRGATLEVRCASASLCQEVRLREAEIAEAVNAGCGSAVVERVSPKM